MSDYDLDSYHNIWDEYLKKKDLKLVLKIRKRIELLDTIFNSIKFEGNSRMVKYVYVKKVSDIYSEKVDQIRRIFNDLKVKLQEMIDKILTKKVKTIKKSEYEKITIPLIVRQLLLEMENKANADDVNVLDVIGLWELNYDTLVEKYKKKKIFEQ